MDALTPFLIRHADHGAFADGIMLHQGVLDLGRIDVLSARDDHVLHPVHDVEKPVLIYISAVARPDPAVDQRCRRLLRLVPIAKHRIRPANADLANRSEEQTSELQSIMRISYAVFCWTKQKTH